MNATTALTRAPYPTSNGRTQWKGTSRPYWPQFTVRTSYAQTLGPMPSDTGNSVPHSSIKNTPAVLTSTLSSAMVSAIFSVIPSKTTNDYGSSTLRMTLDFTSVTKTASREDPSCICHTPTQLWSAETAIVASSPTSNCCTIVLTTPTRNTTRPPPIILIHQRRMYGPSREQIYRDHLPHQTQILITPILANYGE